MGSLRTMLVCAAVLASALAVAAPSGARVDVRSGAPLASPGDAPSGDTGFLTVTSVPPAKLLVDDVDTGKVTPVTRLPLPVGKHRVTLVSDTGAKRSLGVNIAKGEESRLKVTL